MQEEQEEMIKTGKPEKRRPSGFKNGVIIGLVLGLLITGIGAGVGIRAYANLTNNYVIFGPQGVKQTAKDNVLDQAAIKKVDELLSYIDLYYNDSYKEKDIRNAIYKGTLSGLGDPYSVYYTVDEYKDLQTSTNGNYYGIGAALSQNAKTMEVTVVKVYEGTPAEEAGLKNGDEILSVDKYEATSMELSNLVKKIRGKEGTKVHLKVYRSQTGENLEFDVERKNVDIPSVDSKMLSDGIGYIQISEFQSNTAKQFKKALAALEKEDMKGLIVDVRSNPGGLVTSVVDILDQILPEGTVVYTEDKYGKKETYTSDASCIHYPMAVLVNGDSASASEIFAGAIKDYDYGTLIGTKTFGKGIVQTVFPLENGDAIKITTAKYYTPKGHYIHGKGIQPDIKLEYKYSGPEDESYDMKYDNQLQKVKMWNQVFGFKHSGPELEQMAQKIEYPVRKAAHMSEYAVLVLLIFQALTAFDRKKNCGCMALGITAAYAATDEFHQLFVPGRAGRVTDVLIDSAGAFLALLAIHIILYYHKSEIRNRKR